jgi:hypothetical protein
VVAASRRDSLPLAQPAESIHIESAVENLSFAPVTYKVAERSLRSAALAVASAHLALILLDVSVMTSALPNVYVDDLGANCGARFLTHFASGHVLASGGFASAALLITGVYSAFVRAHRLGDAQLGTIGHSLATALYFALGVMSLAFFISAVSQVTILRNPPELPRNPTDLSMCIE